MCSFPLSIMAFCQLALIYSVWIILKPQWPRCLSWQCPLPSHGWCCLGLPDRDWTFSFSLLPFMGSLISSSGKVSAHELRCGLSSNSPVRRKKGFSPEVVEVVDRVLCGQPLLCFSLLMPFHAKEMSCKCLAWHCNLGNCIQGIE